MPIYELSMLIRAADRPTMVATIKRACELIWYRGGVIRSFDHHGYRRLPYRVKTSEGYWYSAHHMVFDFAMPSQHRQEVLSELHRETDLTRPRIIRKQEELGRPCDDRNECDFGEMSFAKKRQLEQDQTTYLKFQ